ncbi:MAG: putative Ig domain-containing protein [Sumerlaeia bacterium]
MVTFASQGIRYPNTVLAIVEKPDGTLYAGGRRMMRLANSTPPVLRMVRDDEPFWDLPPAVVGLPWVFQFKARSGVGPLRFSSDDLPLELRLDAETGILSGTFSSPGPRSFDVTVTDSQGQTDTLVVLRLAVAAEPVTLASAPIEPMTHRMTNRRSVDVTGGNPPYAWRVVDGALPEGVTVEGPGILSGTPQETGTFDFTLEASDVSAQPSIASAQYTLTVNDLEEDTWQIQSSHNRLNFLHFFDENEGVAGGLSGVIIRTIDGGKTWSFESTLDPFESDMIDASFFDDVGLVGTVTGIYRSTDRGRTWTHVHAPNHPQAPLTLPSVEFASESLAFAWNNKVIRSTDGGLTWEPTNAPERGDRYFDLAMGTEQLGWLAGHDGEFFKTTDGGVNWTLQEILDAEGEGPGDADIASVAAVGNQVWVGTSLNLGFAIALYRSEDAGATWTEEGVTPGLGFLTHLEFLDDGQNGWAVGFGRGSISRTTDGGDVWSRVSSFSNARNVTHTSFIDDQTGWVAIQANGRGIDGATVDLQGTIWKTTDGGETWAIQYGLPLRDNDILLEDADFDNHYPGGDLNAISFPTATRGYAVVQDPAARGLNIGDLITTENGGATWDWIRRVSSSTDMVFVTEDHGWIYKDEPRTRDIFETRDGGRTWSYRGDIMSDILGDLNFNFETGMDDLFFIDDQNGWISYDGSIVRTRDSGLTWEVANTEGVTRGSAGWVLHFVDRMNGWRGELDGQKVETTSDGGVNWTPATRISTTGANRIQDIYALDTQNAWATTQCGQIHRTSDGGATWETKQFGGDPAAVWTGIDFTSCLRGYAIGYRPREAFVEVGKPILAETTNASFADSPEQDFGLLNHALLGFHAVDSANAWAAGSYGGSLKYSAATGNLSIGTTGLPLGTVGIAYETALEAINADGAVTWEVCSGALPPGLTLGSTGSISGTPTEAGGFWAIIAVTDSSGASFGRRFTFAINPAESPTIVTDTLPEGQIFADFGAALEATGTNAPYTWYRTTGNLPPGLTLLSTGAVSGRPTLAGTYRFGVEVRDNRTPFGRDRKILELKINGAPDPPPPPAAAETGWVLK